MKKIKLAFADTFGTAQSFFLYLLGQRYEIVPDTENPDILIYGDGNFGYTHKNYDKNKVTKVFYTGENVRPNYDECSFAMTFDHENSGRHYRLPLYVVDMYSPVLEGWTPDLFYLLNKDIDAEKLYEEKEKFCCFIQSNPNQAVRNKFFTDLNEYKKVDSVGPHMNNMGYILPRDKFSYKQEFMEEYRFNIAFENGSHPGYATEKILNAFYANTVPIYWGSPTIHRDFNRKAFVNAFDFKTFDEVIAYVKHLDSPEGKREYINMLAQPAFVGNRPNECMDFNNFFEWWETFVMEGK